jgi:NADH:ubiquinone oxidoreductase subunit E
MSATDKTDRPLDRSGELAGFFGAEPSRPAERVDPGVLQRVEDFLARNSGGPERLIPLLHDLQRRIGHLPFEVQELVADRLGLSPVQVYGVVSFYHQFTTIPRAEHQFKVCLGTACFVRHAQRVHDALVEACDVESGGISKDRLFNLDRVRCIGACGLAPAIMVDDDVHGNVTAAEAREIVRWLRRGTESGERPPEDGPEQEERTS